MAKKAKPMTARKLRLILIAAIVLVFAAGVAVFLLGHNYLSEFAAEASNVSTQANQSDKMLSNLINTEKELKKQSSTVQRVSKLVAESQSYLYQDQIIRDINNYADRAGVSITSIDFNTASATTAQANTASTSTAATASTSAAVSGLKTTSASITLRNPVQYSNMLKFLNYIEQSLTKMSISRVSLSRASDSSGDSVTSDALTIEVYLR